jgi:siroheme synthase
LTAPNARLISVGKRGGCRSTPQRFIEQLLIREARAGRYVVRLKGGDPFVFGRGGEEIAALRAAASRSRSSTASPRDSLRPQRSASRSPIAR